MLNGEVTLRSYTADSCNHSHDFYQWVLPLEGELALEIESHANLVSSSQGALILPEQRHCFASNNSNLFLVLDVPAEKTWIHHSAIPSFWTLSATLQKFLPFARGLLDAQPDLTSYSLVTEVMHKLLMQQFLSHSDPVILKAVHWIDKHFSLPINVNSIAIYCCLSSSQLQRRFKQIMGQSVGEYWRKKRLQQARTLLRQSALSIEAIAHAVGYENLAAFSRSFSQEYSISPLQFRNLRLTAKNMLLADKA